MVYKIITQPTICLFSKSKLSFSNKYSKKATNVLVLLKKRLSKRGHIKSIGFREYRRNTVL